jgi:hypothetical protein
MTTLVSRLVVLIFILSTFSGCAMHDSWLRWQADKNREILGDSYGKDPLTRSAEPTSQPLFNECMKKYSLKECEKFKEGKPEDEGRHQ